MTKILPLSIFICFSLQSMERVCTQKDLNADLMTAVKENNIRLVKKLLKKGASPDTVNSHKRTPLSYASALGRFMIAELLIRKGADVTAQDTQRRTPLHFAAQAGESTIVNLLLKNKAALEAQDSKGRTALYRAIKAGKKEVAQTLIKWGAHFTYDKQGQIFCRHAEKNECQPLVDLLKKGNSPRKVFLQALKKGDLPWVQDLFIQGAQANRPFKGGKFPLHYAAEYGHLNIAHCLLMQGAALWALDANEETPLALSEKMGHQTLGSLLTIQAASNSALFKAVKKGEITAVKKWLLEGAQVTARSASWITPLHYACARGDNELVDHLLENKATINAQDKEGSTPLHWATGSSCRKLIPVLSHHGADIDCTDRYGSTALHWAACAGATRMVCELIKAGAAINKLTHDGKTPLYLAAQEDEEETARFLLAQGGLLNRYDRADTELFYQPPQGHTMKELLKVQITLDTQLFKAVKRGNFGGVKALLSKGARVNARDASLRNPLHYASQKGDLRVVYLLLEHGAHVKVQDKNNETPYCLADKRHHKQVVTLLKNHNPLNTRLFKAVKEDNLESAKELLKDGAQVNARTYLQETSLHRAATQGSETMVLLVISYGADLTATDHTRKTALDWAISKNYQSIEKLLRKQQRTDEDLFRAINQGDIKLVEKLLKKGARVMARNAQQRTPLHAATFHGLDAIASLLLKKGADPHARDENGKTPLVLAPRNSREQIRELFEHHKRSQ